jgi:hypothetical protein
MKRDPNGNALKTTIARSMLCPPMMKSISAIAREKQPLLKGVKEIPLSIHAMLPITRSINAVSHYLSRRPITS